MPPSPTSTAWKSGRRHPASTTTRRTCSVPYDSPARGWYLAACAGRYENQALDDAGTAFDAWGCEVVALRDFSPRWQGVVGWNHLAPDEDGYAGEYRLDYQVLELRYRFGPRQSFFCANYQLNNGRTADGQSRDDVIAGCFYYYF